MTIQQDTEALTEDGVRLFVQEWFSALDRHAPEQDVLPLLVDEDPTVVLPEGTLRTVAGFRDWYHTVTHRFFDETHTLTRVDVRLVSPGEAAVSLVVNWQANIWDPPAAKSVWLGFDATQEWTVVLQAGQARISVYDVKELAPMPGSAGL
jgi:SnoaL-like domain